MELSPLGVCSELRGEEDNLGRKVFRSVYGVFREAINTCGIFKRLI